MSWTRRFGISGLLIALMLVMPQMVRADDGVDQRSVDRAHNFLKTAERGRDILSYMHFGTKYVRHQYKESCGVNDGDRKQVPGHFALIYTYDWNEDGTTDVAFLCDRRGNVYKVQVVKHNAIINEPFAMANVSIKLLGNLLIEAFKNQMTAAERRQARSFVDEANAKGLLEMSLQLQQTFGK